MLVLTRKVNQAIMVGDDVRIIVVAVDRDQVKLGIEAPRSIPVHRSEVYEEIQRANQAAAARPPVAAAAPSSKVGTAPLRSQQARGPKPPKLPQ